MFLQNNHVNELITRAWDVQPETIYGLFAGGAVLIAVAGLVVARQLFTFANKKIEEKERQMIEERHRAQERHDKLAGELMSSKIEAVGALRDILNALNVISVSQNNNKEEIIDTVDRLKESLIESINRIK